MGWTTVKNGELLALASTQFDAIVTVDRNLAYQQNIGRRPIAIIVLRTRSNRLADLKPLVPALMAALQSTKPGEVKMVEGK